jgi:hypothetical protein
MSTRPEKIPPPLRPEVAERAWSARESWRVFAIMAEFVEATERLNPIAPAVRIFGSARVRPDSPLPCDPDKVVEAIFDHYRTRGFGPSAREREMQLNL